MTKEQGRFCVIVDYQYDKAVIKARVCCVGSKEHASTAFEVYSEDGHKCCLFNLTTMEVVERSVEPCHDTGHTWADGICRTCGKPARMPQRSEEGSDEM